MYKVEDYLELIYKEAWVCFNKLQRCGVSYELEDIVQDGVVTFYKILFRYDASKAKLSTILTIGLRNSYCNLLRFEIRRASKWESLDSFTEVVDEQDYDSRIFLSQLEKKLTAGAWQIAKCILGLDSEYLLWLDKKEWARRNLGVRYKRKRIKSSIQEYFGRDISFELSEIATIL